MDLLITNARVWDDRAPVDIAIEGERIVAIEPRIKGAAGRVIDAEGRAVLPGFVEPHLHLDKALLYRRQPARDGTLAEAIRLTGQLKAEQDRDDVLDRSRAVLDMAVAHGTVAIRAHPDVDPIQGLLGVETALALREEYRDLLDLEAVAFPQEGIVKAPGTLELMEQAFGRIDFRPPAARTTSRAGTRPAAPSTSSSISRSASSCRWTCTPTSPTTPPTSATPPPGTSPSGRSSWAGRAGCRSAT